MRASKRDTNRTKARFLKLAAIQAKRLYGEDEAQFLSNLKPEFHELARRIYRETEV